MLRRAADEASRQARGRFKVFFGASPGVGKTFAMLSAARRLRESGVDVVAGVVETHGRAETGALLEGMEAIPRRRVEHRGIVVEEFDPDAALARRPQLLLVDELAHTNAPGSRHLKRWQDVLELIDAGIDVFTTMNVQHVDSLNDVVTQITGVTVRETVPDSVLEQADEIELVDLPVEELRQRLEEGKVYIPDQAQRAMMGFFRPGNLIALRELALRRTAEHVDAQMRDYRREHAIRANWPVTERLIVSIGPSPFSAKLIRAAKRISERLGAEWIVAYVETPKGAGMSEEARQRVRSALRLADQLGAETVTLAGADVADTLLAYARSRNVSRIVLGKRAGPLLARLWRGSVLDDVLAKSGDIEVIAVSGEREAPPPAEKAVPRTAKVAAREFAWCAATVAVCTVGAVLLRGWLDAVNLAMLYLLGVVAAATRFSRRASVFTSVLSVAAFDFFCVPPFYTFAVSDYEFLVTFAVMLTVALVISSMTAEIRLQAQHAAEREGRTRSLYRLTQELARQTGWMEAARAAASITREVFGGRVILFFSDEEGRISFRNRTSDELPLPRQEESIAQWVFENGRPAGKGTGTLPGAAALYLPLKGAQKNIGVLAMLPAGEAAAASPEQEQLLEVFASQTGLALERIRTAAQAREAQLRAETEQMRSGLLSAVSHDLRTPLAAITGAASSLRTQREQIPVETQLELLESIESGAARLGRIVSNLLEMTRLQSGAFPVKREWHPLDEIVGEALSRVQGVLDGRTVASRFAAELMVQGDGVLLEQVLWNLLENAARYTPARTPVEIGAWEENGGVTIEVADRGPGFAKGEEELVWEKFFRGSGSEERGGRSAGLGLAICRSIVMAHGGRISAANRDGGGAAIRFWLPYVGPRPEAPHE